MNADQPGNSESSEAAAEESRSPDQTGSTGQDAESGDPPERSRPESAGELEPADQLADSEEPPDVGPGRRLGVDVGGTRVGIAVSDPAPMLATPVETVRRDKRGDKDLRRLAALIREYQVVEVIVGLPVTLAGEQGHAAGMAQLFADALAKRIAVPVRFSDERLTTVTASRMLSERGVRGKKQRAVVDQAAAVEILQAWLDARGRDAGRDSW